MPTRRDVFVTLAGLSAAGAAFPGMLLAGVPTERRLVVVILRGGLDGLSAVVPFGDPHYEDRRGHLALPPPGDEDGVVDLDGFFGLHPALADLEPWFGSGEALFLHAAATPYRDRSHFAAQNILENGTTRSGGAGEGWLNRALAALGPADWRNSVAVARSLPLILKGPVPASTLAPFRPEHAEAEFLEAVARLYEDDPLLGPALKVGLEAQAMADRHHAGPMRASLARRQGVLEAFAANAGLAGRLLASEDGPRIAVLEVGGFDTHADQGAVDGMLPRRLGRFADGLGALRRALGPEWRRTAVLVATEFGRAASPNGSRGTDHGTGGVAMLLGGAVRGGRVIGSWPGLGEHQLHEGRDVAPTTDLRSLFKGVLMAHLGLDEAVLEDRVFPESRRAHPLDGLIRA